MKRALLTLLALGVLAVGAYAGYSSYKYQKTHGGLAPEAIDLEDLEEKTSEQGSEIPLELNIDMPFYAQAPHGNWDYPWQEACEEASVLLVANLYDKMNLDIEAFNMELLRLVGWEVDYFGAYEHTTVAQTSEMMELQYGFETVVRENPSFEDLQSILAQGHLIIAPFAGKLLGNPNYRNGGPNYHMLVIKGYDAKEGTVVTHDVGTRNGANYVYTWEVIENALHDWHPTDMTLGRKLILEVLPT